MDQAAAITRAREHLALYRLTLNAISFAHRRKRRIFRRGAIWHLRAESSAGLMRICIDDHTGVVEFEIEPEYRDAAGRMLPLWLVYPSYTSVTAGWRQGTGETYKLRWHSWWRTLDAEGKAAYRAAYPEPIRSDLCWSGFYDEIAERPSSGSIGDFIDGRV